MENTPKGTLPNPSDDSTSADSAQTLATPHFDEESIQSARPAVPLVQIRERRFWRLALVLMCISSFAGGVVGIALSRYQNRPKQISAPVASVTPEETSQDESAKALSHSVAGAEEKLNDAEPAYPERVADGRAIRTGEKSTVDAERTSKAQDGDPRAALHHVLDELIAATNARDIQRQMGFYGQRVNAFYLKRDVPREAVRAEKSRVFDHASLIDIRAAAPGISLSPDGRDATMRFRKKYAIEGGGLARRGEVLHELRWHRTADGWKIVSERDLRVIH